MAAHPRRKCLTREPLGHVDVIAAFASKIENLRDIDVPQFLRRRYMLLKPLALGRIDTLCRDQRHKDWFPGSLIHGFVAGCGTGDIGCVQGTVILKTDAVILEECRALHKPASLATVQLRSGRTVTHSTVILAASCLAFALGRA